MNKTKQSKVVVYSPESPILRPLHLLKDMMFDLRASFPLAYRLTARDISATYRQTALGYFWAILPPLVKAFPFDIGMDQLIIVGIVYVFEDKDLAFLD